MDIRKKYCLMNVICLGIFSVIIVWIRKQQVASCELRVASWTNKQQVASYSLVNSKLHFETTSCKLVFTSWTNEQQVASWFLQFGQNKLRVGFYDLDK